MPKKKSLFRNSRGIAIQQTTGEFTEGPRQAIFMDRECKEERIQLESVKIKNKWGPALRIPSG